MEIILKVYYRFCKYKIKENKTVQISQNPCHINKNKSNIILCCLLNSKFNQPFFHGRFVLIPQKVELWKKFLLFLQQKYCETVYTNTLETMEVFILNFFGSICNNRKPNVHE